MAAYERKADTEWDLKFLHPNDRSYRDELIAILWGIPLVGMWVPGMRDFSVEGFKAMAAIHETLPQVYAYGWIAILTFVFGGRTMAAPFLASRHAKLVEALGAVRDDIPPDVVSEAQNAIGPYRNDYREQPYPFNRPPV